MKRSQKKKSKLELKFARFLKDNKIHCRYESQRFKYKVSKVKTYVNDFPIRKADGSWMYLETKGWFRPEDRTKILYVIESNPGIDLRLIFQYDNRLNKNTETRYTDWCKKHNIKFHIGIGLPEEWIKELKPKGAKH